MKKRLTLFVLLIISTSQLIFSQSNNSVEFNIEDLSGVWYLKYNRKKDNLILEKKISSESSRGVRIEILKNGKFHHRYSARCGNDRRLFTGNYKGEWELDKVKGIIKTTKPLEGDETIYKIVSLLPQKLILSAIKTE